MVWAQHEHEGIPGTYVFDGRRATMAYGLNKMCMTFNSAENRERFKRDPDAYCKLYALTEEQLEAVRSHDYLRLVQLGGHIYYLAKLAGIFGTTVQDDGAQCAGVTVEEFKAKLVAAGE